MSENHPMLSDPFSKTYEAAAAALPFAVDAGKITMESGVSYLPSPIKLRDYPAVRVPSQRVPRVGLVLDPSGPKHQSSGDGFALPAQRT